MGTNPHFVSHKNIENKTVIPINAPISQHKSLGTLNMTQFHSTTYLACIMAPILFMEILLLCIKAIKMGSIELNT